MFRWLNTLWGRSAGTVPTPVVPEADGDGTYEVVLSTGELVKVMAPSVGQVRQHVRIIRPNDTIATLKKVK